MLRTEPLQLKTYVLLNVSGVLCVRTSWVILSLPLLAKCGVRDVRPCERIAGVCRVPVSVPVVSPSVAQCGRAAFYGSAFWLRCASERGGRVKGTSRSQLVRAKDKSLTRSQ